MFSSFFISGLLLVLDRFLKHIAVHRNGFFIFDFLVFNLVKNKGVALSITLPMMLILILTIICLVWLTVWVVGRRKDFDKLQIIALVTVIASGIDNLFDRLFYDYVIDYFEINFYRWIFAFNLADVMIVVGIGLFVISELKKRRSENIIQQHQADRIIQLNQKTYNQIATQFHQTREKPLWPEFYEFKRYIKEGDSILDIGCGNGRLIKLFENFKINYTGVDNSEALLSIAQSQTAKITLQQSQIKFIKTDLTNLPFQTEAFNHIFMIASLHHLPPAYHLKALKAAHRVLKIGGYLLMTNFNLWKLSLKEKTVWRYGFKKDVMTYWDNQFPLYYYAFTLKKLKKQCQQAGFQIIKADYTTYGQKAHFWNGSNIVIVAKKCYIKTGFTYVL